MSPLKPFGTLDRRDFLVGASGAIAGLMVTLTGCRPSDSGDGPAIAAVTEFPYLEVAGTPYEVGLAIGGRFKDRIREGLRRRSAWFNELRTFMQGDPASRYDPFLAAGRKYFPDIVEELRGWADGSGVPFEDLMVLNLKAELATMRRNRQEETPGCSTLALSHGGQLLLAHNEDGHEAYRDLMFLLKVTLPGKPTYLCLTYPGILPGNGPAMNEAGLIVTTNFIGGLAVRSSVPRYFISRAVLEAANLDEAVAIITHPERSFAFHFNLGSRHEKKILSVETAVDRFEVHEIDGLYVHTNHLLLPRMVETAQDSEYVNTSSMSRYRVLHDRADSLRDRLGEVTSETLVDMLSDHKDAPYSPCRHPTDDVSGSTLGTAVFDMSKHGISLFNSNPCQGNSTLYNI